MPYLALIADGVALDKIYDELGTPEGVDRAFMKLDTIKKDVVWWEAGAQPVQLLADGEGTMATGYNGRFFDAMVGEGKPFEIIWDGQYMDLDMFAIPKGSPNPEAAMQYLEIRHRHPAAGRSGEIHRLWPVAQKLGQAGWPVPGLLCL